MIAGTIFLQRIISAFPLCLSCLLRWKENINIEHSVKSARDRNTFAWLMFLPFCLILYRYAPCPEYLIQAGSVIRLIAVSAVVLLFLFIRKILSKIISPKKADSKILKAAYCSIYNIFPIAMTVMLLSLAGMNLTGIGIAAVKNVLLCEGIFFYTVFLLRKVQIFTNLCSVFVAILYLCALELIPTALLVASLILI
ncbi:membrane protein [gut metagenome]|uniref:Membrane protein n=1 Tax=gut metagenome TaxID=749906 RepID=J9G773_9ZZZZ